MELVRHETCLQYFQRRLSEGWKCISLEGHNAVLLSPDGIRRELDLRNDVETLRPNAPGDETSISIQFPDSDEHWDKVDEVAADEDTTYIMENNAQYGLDLFKLPASSGSGTINFIKIYFRCRIQSPPGPFNGYAWPNLKSNGTVTRGSVVTLFKDELLFTTFSEQWNVNPADGEAWEWADIDALQIGVELQGSYGSYHSQCTQIYVEVDYGPAVAPTVIAKPATSVEATTARSNGEVTDNGGVENPTVHIYWGTSDGETTPANWDHDENLGVKAVDTFYKDISGLTRGTKYYYRCFAVNSGGSVWSNAAEFTTLLEKPVAASNAATGVGVTAATINGTATDDGGGSCQYRFRYKKADGDYAYTEWTGAKATGETFSEGITGLDASSTYYFNAQVKNSQFVSGWGAELTFDTGAAVVAPTGTTDAATLIADIKATLNGTVDGDGGEACEVRFQYGLTAAYGTNTAWQPGKLTNDTFSQVISGLTPNTLYHFRAQVKNSDSTADGADETFTTEYFPTPFIRRVLRDMFGGGADISAANPLQVYDPKVFNSLVVYEGTATADGPDTSTITDTVLAGKPDYNGQLLCITSGAYDGQTRDIDQPTDEGDGKAHVAKAFDGTIVSGTTYVILSIRPTTAEVADIEAKLDHATYGLEALKDLIVALGGANRYLEEIPDTDVSDTATTTEAECILLNVATANKRYCLRNLRVKAQADPVANTMTVKLYEQFDGGLVEVDSFDIDTNNWETHHSLVDMFGLREIHSDAIKVTCVMDADTLAVKATYDYAIANTE